MSVKSKRKSMCIVLGDGGIRPLNMVLFLGVFGLKDHFIFLVFSLKKNYKFVLHFSVKSIKMCLIVPKPLIYYYFSLI